MLEMRDSSKIRLLNKLIAAQTPFSSDIYANAARGIGAALESGDADTDIAAYAKKILRLYDPNAEIEVLNFSDGFFDPLFALPIMSTAAKRLSGFPRAILVIYGLDKLPEGRRTTPKRRREYAGNIASIEGFLTRYEKAFPNLEIIFL